jgi:Protein of unknown function (DUF3551)
MGSSVRRLSKTDSMSQIKTTTGRKAMKRKPLIALFVITAALLVDTQISNAQSPYSYPWCAVYGRKGAMSCYYTSWEQCRTTLSGIGGNCVQSPYYHAQPTQLPHRSLAKSRHRRHA